MFKKIVSNTISQIISKAFTAIISIFLISLLTNYLPLETYWLYSKIYNYIWIFVFLADLWLYAITIKEISKNKKESAKIVWNVMSLRLILWIFILFLAIFIAIFIPWYNSELALISIFIASIFTILQLLNSSILALMQANMKIEFQAFSITFAKLINLGIIASIAYFFYPKEFIENSNYFTPFLYIMFATVISTFINTLLNFFYARKIVKFGFAWDFSYIKYIFKTSLPYWIALFLSVFYFKMDVMLLTILEWAKKWDISTALYSVPMKVVEVIMVIWGFYMTSILPKLSEYFKNLTEKNKKLLNKLINISFKIMFGFASMVVTLWILFREKMILIIANKNYLENTWSLYNSSDAFLVVFAVLLFYFLSLIFIYTLVASDKQNKLLKINIIVTIFNFIWNIFLIPKYSFIWAWIITFFSQILLFILWYFATKKIIKFSLPIWFFIKNIIFWVFIFIIWNYILINFSVSLYFDFFIYWWILFIFYLIFHYFQYKKNTF